MESASTSDQPSQQSSRRNVRAALPYAFAVVLLAVGLVLPPANLITRLANVGYQQIGAQGGSVYALDGAAVSFSPASLGKTAYVQLRSVPLANYEAKSAGKELAGARDAMPSSLSARSSIYHLVVHGPAPRSTDIEIPIPADAEPTTALDVYAWDGKAWTWLPSLLKDSEDLITSHADSLPAYFAVMLLQPAAAARSLPETGGARSAPAMAPAPDGGLAAAGSACEASSAGSPTLPRVTNVNARGVAELQAVEAVLADSDLSAKHASAIADWASKDGLAGVLVDYRGLAPDLRGQFTDLISALRDRLGAIGTTLAVRVPAARRDGEKWDTGAYDWAALGRIADSLQVVAAVDPRLSAPGADLYPMLAWATSQVNRLKLTVCFNSLSEDLVGDRVAALLPADEALAPLNSVAIQQSNGEVLPGQSVTLAVKANELQVDQKANAYYYERAAPDGSIHTVWLEDNATLTRKLLSVVPYRVGQVCLMDVDADDENTQQMLQTLASFGEVQGDIARAEYTVMWTVQNQQGTPVARSTSTLEDSSFTYSSDIPGVYSVSAAIQSGSRALSSRGERASLNVVTPTPTSTRTPTPTATPTPTETPLPSPTSPPKAAAPAAAPSGGVGFGYGIQAHFISQGDHDRIIGAIKGMGFNWVKQQVRWGDMERNKGQIDWGELDRMVNDCSANGLNILLSVVTAPLWSRPGDTDKSVAGPPANPDEFAQFIAAVAARYRGKVQAYEVWNEQNLFYEWGGKGKRLSAAAYVDLLKRAFYAIKAADPTAVVVSGALTPTGWHDYDTAVDDAVYLEEMYLNGLSKYCDAVGVHPSGYNNPPDAVNGYTDPAEPGAKGHRSWFFRSTMERYREIMVVYGDGWKRLWPTEFGWASVEGLGVAPVRGYEYAANNSEAEQAQFIVRAYQMARNWGWVGPMFLWNLNYAPVAGNADEKAAFGIVRGDWSFRPAYYALANMPK